jgi:membrane protein involved in colicin uptake
MRVRAIQDGIYGDARIAKGQEFDLAERVYWKTDPKTGEREQVVLSPKDQFSEAWMVKVHAGPIDRALERARAKEEEKARLKTQLRAEQRAKEAAAQAEQAKKDAAEDAKAAAKEAREEFEAEQKAQAEADARELAEAEGSAEAGVKPDYESWTVEQLKAECDKRGLERDSDWIKHDYVLALKKHDRKAGD